MSITIYQGSIFDVEADCIVNPANSFLQHTGGLARIIADTATQIPTYPGKQEDIEARTRWSRDHEAAPLVATGNAHLTSAGRLPYKGVIHAVGPIWNGGTFFEHGLLQTAHDSALKVASQAGFKSIVFPAISCGIFGFPVERAATLAVAVAGWYEDMDITFALFEDAHVEAYRAALDGRPA